MSLLDRLQRDGARASLPERRGGSPDPRLVTDNVRCAVETDDATLALAGWDAAGRAHDPDTLDQVLSELTRRGPLPFLGGGRIRDLLRGARAALAQTNHVGTLQLAAAVIGAVGERRDVPALETIAAHPALALHGVTALANLRHRDGRAALLRLLSRTQGETRVLVIDRLLAHCREPAVRLALVRDAFVGLEDEHAREVAPAVAATLDLAQWLEQPRVPDDLRQAARHILRLAGR